MRSGESPAALSAENKDSILGSFCEAYIVDGDGNLLQYPLTCETLREGSALETTFFFPAEVLPESGTVLVSISYGVVDEPGHPEVAQLQELFVPVPVK